MNIEEIIEELNRRKEELQLGGGAGRPERPAGTGKP